MTTAHTLRVWLTVVALLCAAPGPGSAQQAQQDSQKSPPQAAPEVSRPPSSVTLRPPYLPNAANEDWSVLKDPATRTDFWDWAKYIPLGDDNRFMTLSAEVRYRPEGFHIKGTDATPSIHDNYLLQRYLFGTDVRFGPGVRVFTEFQSGIINGKLSTVRPPDQNALDIHQAFFEVRRTPGQDKRFNLRIGRQELTIGSSRLISASPGLNTKRSFDGVRLVFGRSAWTVESAAAVLTNQRSGVFDDDPEQEVKFWGVAAARSSPRVVKGVLVLYYLGVLSSNAQFAQGRGRDLRHTFGAGWRGSASHVDLNYDAVLQTGSFNSASARAWAISTETGYRFTTRWAPRIALRANSTSGDHDAADPRLQSFNPLFPGASYSGVIGLFGPTNLTDLTPEITVKPRTDLVIGCERPYYWRTSTGDGLYNINLQLMIPPGAGTGHFVGRSIGVFVVWQAARHLQVTGTIIRLASGGFLQTSFVGKGAGLYSISTSYRF